MEEEMDVKQELERMIKWHNKYGRLFELAETITNKLPEWGFIKIEDTYLDPIMLQEILCESYDDLVKAIAKAKLIKLKEGDK